MTENWDFKKHENWKTTSGLFTDILERIKYPSIKQIYEKIVYFRLNFIGSFKRRAWE